jgi:hypothetical protein
MKFGRTYNVRFSIRIDFKKNPVITFIGLDGFQSSSYLCTCICKIMTKCQSYTFLAKKSFVKYRWRTYNRWQFTLIPVVSSSGMTYANVVSVPTEKHNRYRYNHTSPLIPQVTHVRLMLHEQCCICYKNVFTS